MSWVQLAISGLGFAGKALNLATLQQAFGGLREAGVLEGTRRILAPTPVTDGRVPITSQGDIEAIRAAENQASAIASQPKTGVNWGAAALAAGATAAGIGAGYIATQRLRGRAKPRKRKGRKKRGRKRKRGRKKSRKGRRRVF